MDQAQNDDQLIAKMFKQALKHLRTLFRKHDPKMTDMEKKVHCLPLYLTRKTLNSKTFKKDLYCLYKKIKTTSFLQDYLAQYTFENSNALIHAMWRDEQYNCVSARVARKTKKQENINIELENEAVKSSDTESIAKIEEVVRTDMEETAMSEEIDEEEQEELTEEELVFYEKIIGTERYRWIGYLNIRVIEDTETGYINATKMCFMYGKTKGGQPKQFRDWKPYNEPLIKIVARSERILAHLLTVIVDSGINDIRGTYVHRDLAPHIAMWCSEEFGYKVSKIVNAHITDAYKKLKIENQQLTAEKGTYIIKIDEQTHKIDKQTHKINEQTHKIDEQMQKIDEQTHQIKSLVNELQCMRKENERQTDKIDCLLDQNDHLIGKVDSIHSLVEPNVDNVILLNAQKYLNEIVVLMHNAKSKTYIVLRVQGRRLQQSISDCRATYGQDTREVFRIENYANSVNMFNLFKEYAREHDLLNRINFKRTVFTTELPLNEITQVFTNLERTFREEFEKLVLK